MSLATTKVFAIENVFNLNTEKDLEEENAKPPTINQTVVIRNDEATTLSIDHFGSLI